jgi:hypothetical protein
MLVLDLTTGEVIQPDEDQPTAYPGEVFQMERLVVREALQTVRPDSHDLTKTEPAVIHAAMDWLEHNC